MIRWESEAVKISFAVQGQPTSRESWLALARRAEELGFEALSIADHPGTTASPFVALAAAAQVTQRIQLAPSVINAGAWEPLALAAEVATLDVVSDRRTLLGIGAGHTPREWSQVGREFPTARQRLDHLEAVVSCVRRLLAGERVTFEKDSVCLNDAALEWPAPSRNNVPVLIGGNARGLVALAARHADVLELTGLGRTLSNGHAHQALWATEDVDERVQLLHASRGANISLGALVQKVEIASDRTGAAEAYRSLMATALPEEHLPTLEEILETPFLLIGTEDQIVEQLRTNQTRWGFTRYTTREPDIDRVSGIIERLT